MIITKEEFHKMDIKLGGDLWNTYKLCAISFKKFPDAKSIEFSLGTGLWATIKYTTDNGDSKYGDIFESDPIT
jgi:hypothetical protein